MYTSEGNAMKLELKSWDLYVNRLLTRIAEMLEYSGMQSEITYMQVPPHHNK
jgi:hypothetical protein